MGTNITADQVLTWGRKAAQDLVGSGIPLVSSISKTAEDHSLNLEQITRVCEAANQSTFASLHGDRMDRLIGFKVAHAKDVLEGLNSPTEKVAMAMGDDYTLPPPKEDDGLQPNIGEVMDTYFPKTASDVRDRVTITEENARIRAHINKVAAAKSELDAEMVGHQVESTRSEDKLFYEVKKKLVEGNDFDDVYNMIVGSPAGEFGSDVSSLMRRVLERLKQDNLVAEETEIPDSVNAGTEENNPHETVVKQACEILRREKRVRLLEKAAHLCNVEMETLYNKMSHV
jgi:hypothetical protein